MFLTKQKAINQKSSIKMKKKLLFILIILHFVGLNIILAQEKVLFIGNSMTYYNNMPQLFQEIANDKGKNVQAQFYAPGGTGFVNHHLDNNVYQLFRDNLWDIVVLQPGTSESAGVSWPVNTTIQRGLKMMDSIKKYSPCAKILLYEIPYGIKANNNVPDYNDYFNVQTKIRDSITKMANGMQIPFVPAGECARNHLTQQQDLLLHNGYNDVHPNLNGSYLVACSMFTTIYQEEVSPTNYLGGVTQANATYFQGISDQVVLPNKANWLLNTFNTYADFNYSINNLTVDFTNISVNFDTVEWDFGDGETSNENNPSHLFNSAGEKTIILKAFKNNCEITMIKTITIGVLDEPIFLLNKYNYYPNPAKDFLTISASEKFTVTILNTVGQIVLKSNQPSNKHILNLMLLQKGIYFIQTDNSIIKFFKE